MHCLRPATIAAAARAFVAGVSGRRAVRGEVQPRARRAARAVAPAACAISTAPRSPRCAGAQMFPDAAIHFMHPVKARGAIREAWARHGVRDFVLDTRRGAGEDPAGDRRDRRRRRTRPDRPPGAAERRAPCSTCPASSAPRREAAVACCAPRASAAARLGVCFHVGSQCLDPLAWRVALDRVAGEVIAAPASRSRWSMSAAAFRCLSGRRAAAARRLPGRDRGRLRAHWAAGCAALGGAWPGAGGRRRVGRRAGAAAPRRRTVYQRRRLWQPGRCRRARVPLSGAADPA